MDNGSGWFVRPVGQLVHLGGPGAAPAHESRIPEFSSIVRVYVDPLGTPGPWTRHMLIPRIYILAIRSHRK